MSKRADPRWIWLPLWLGLPVAAAGCGAAQPAFRPPVGAETARLRACQARVDQVPADPLGHRCLRQAARALGQSAAVATHLAARPERPPGYAAQLARAELDADPGQALRTAQACQVEPACALVVGLAQGRLRAPEAARRALLPLANGSGPLAAEAAASLALSWLDAGHAQAAEPWLNRARRLGAEAPATLRAEARAALAAGHPSAEALVHRALHADLSHPDGHLLAAHAAQQAGRAEQALQALRRAVFLAPGHEGARLTLADRLLARGAHAAALDHLSLLVGRHPADPHLGLRMGQALLASGAPLRALAWAERLLETDGAQAPCLLLKFEALVAAGRVEAGLAVRDALLRLDDQPGVRLRLAGSLTQAGRLAAAEAELADAVARHPTAADAWIAYGRFHAERGRPAHGATLLERGLSRAPDAAALHAALAEVRERLEDLKGARAAMAAASARAPGQADYADELARLTFMTGATEEGIAAWEDVLAAHPKAQRARLRLSHAYRAVGRPADALPLLEALAAEQPDSGKIQGHLGDTLMALGRVREAVVAFQAALRGGAPAGEVQGRLAEALLAAGDHDAALAAYQQALAAQPGDQALWLALARAQAKGGDTAGAVGTYAQVLARWPEHPGARLALRALVGPEGAPALLAPAVPWPAATLDPTLAELAAQVPEGSAARPATVLRDEREVVVDARGIAEVVHRRSVLVHRQDASEHHAEARIAFHASHPPEVRVARTLTPDGQVLPVGPDRQSVQNPHAGTPLYGDGRTLVLAFAGVEPGAIVDYEVITRRPQADLPGAWWDGYILANAEPTVQVRYVLDMPAALKLAVRAPGLGEPTRTTPSPGRARWAWVARDVAGQALKASKVNEVPGVYVSSLPSWAAVDRWYHGLFAPQAQPSPAIRARARAIAAQAATPRARVAAVYAAVEAEIAYLGLEFGVGAFRPRPAGDTLTSGKGDCKDMTALMVALLAALEIPAYPALLRPRDQGAFIEAHPSPGQFSHVVLYVPSLDLWLDATAGLGTLEAVPGVLRGQMAFVVDGQGGSLRQIPAGDPAAAPLHAMRQVLVYDLTPTGGGRLAAEVAFSGDLAGSARQKLIRLPPASRDALLRAPGQLAGAGLSLPAVSLGGLQAPGEPLVLKGELRHRDLAGVRLDGALVLPLDLSFLTDGPLAAFAADALPEGPRVIERRLVLRPPPGYRFDWPVVDYAGAEGPVRIEVQEARSDGAAEILARITFSRGHLDATDRVALLLALRAAHRAVQRPLEMHPPPGFDRAGFLKAMAEEQPRNGELQLLAGEALVHAGRPREAVAPLQRAQAAEVDDPRLLALLSAALFRADDHAGARASLEALVARPDALPAAHLMLAALLTDEGRHQDAAAALSRGVQRHPEDLRLHQRLVAALGRAGDRQAALQAAQAMARAHPDRREAHALLGDVANDLGEVQRAVAAYRAALALAPDQARILNNLAWLLRDAPQTRAEALALAARAVALEPDADAAWDTLAVLRRQAGDLAGAQQALERALETAPPHRRATYLERQAAWAEADRR